MLGRLAGATGRAALDLVHHVGSLSLTGWDGTRRLVRSFFPGERFRARTVIEQVMLMGATAVPIIALIALMMGLILAFQSAYQLERLGAEIYIADLVAVSMTRELGPVITAIVVAGRSGSSIAAEIATMKIQEELDALEVMGLNAVAFLVAPKLLAMAIAIPLLTAIADLVSILGGLACATWVLDLSPTMYLSRTQEALLMRDFLSGLMKAVIFGGVIVTVGAWCGFSVRGGAEAVGRATTRSVVLGIFLVIVADLIFTGLFYNLTR